LLHLPASLRAAMHRSSLALEAFSVGNLAWMAATVGLVFQEADSQPRRRRGGAGHRVACAARTPLSS